MEPEEAQKLIDEDILALKTRRNTYARISRLPNEILLKIFATLQKHPTVDFDIDVQGWHHVTHICQHWRRVALECASLWTNPPADRHDYTLLMLERSRTSPLYVDIDLNTSEDTLLAILDHVDRIKALFIQHSASTLQLFQGYLQASGTVAPLLCTLEITQTQETGSDPWSDPFRLSDTLFIQFPSLKRISLGGVDFDWKLLPFRSKPSVFELVCLELSKTPSWTQFYEALRQMPSLEYLNFTFDELDLVSPPHVADHLELPLLHSLVVQDSCGPALGSFLTNSSFPLLRNASFECHFDHPDDLSTTIRAVQSLIPKGSFGRLDQLEISDSFFSLNRSSESDNDRHPEVSDNLGFTVTRWAYSRKLKIAQELMEGFATLPSSSHTSQITDLHLSTPLTSKQFSKLFGSLPHLQEIATDGIGSQQVIESLMIPQQHQSHLPLPFSNVKSLRISGQVVVEEYTPKLLEKLITCLVRRSERGVGLTSLYVQWCLGEEEALRLQDIVADVDWGLSEDDSDSSSF